jgi:hypothetical protein
VTSGTRGWRLQDGLLLQIGEDAIKGIQIRDLVEIHLNGKLILNHVDESDRGLGIPCGQRFL